MKDEKEEPHIDMRTMDLRAAIAACPCGCKDCLGLFKTCAIRDLYELRF